MSNSNEPDVLSRLIPLRQAARLLPVKVNQSTVWSWASKGIAIGDERIYLRVYALGKRLFVDPDDLRSFALKAGKAKARAWAAEREAEVVSR